MNCRFDGLPIKNLFVDLGYSPASNSFLSQSQLAEPEVYYPLKLYVSDRTFLVQVDEVKKKDEIFDENYVYFSSFSSSWLAHCKQYVDMMIERFGFNSNSMIVEIASNDGYLLQYFKEYGVKTLGIEPTLSTATAARSKGIETHVDFFGIRLANELRSKNIKCDLILGNNVLAHVPDVNDFVGGLPIILSENGVVTFEFPHILQLLLNSQFDTIYHEHFSYLSLHTVDLIFAAHGLTLFDVEEIPTHGGSLRIYAKHQSCNAHDSTDRLTDLRIKEEKFGIKNLETYLNFADKVSRVRNEFVKFLIECSEKGKKVMAYGAAAKGNTLLNFCGIKHDLIVSVVDANPAKQNKFLPGSHIPVVKEEELQRIKPDYVIIFPWNIKEEIMGQLQYIRSWGGEFVVAIPSLKII